MRRVPERSRAQPYAVLPPTDPCVERILRIGSLSGSKSKCSAVTTAPLPMRANAFSEGCVFEAEGAAACVHQLCIDVCLAKAMVFDEGSIFEVEGHDRQPEFGAWKAAQVRGSAGTRAGLCALARRRWDTNDVRALGAEAPTVLRVERCYVPIVWAASGTTKWSMKAAVCRLPIERRGRTVRRSGMSSRASARRHIRSHDRPAFLAAAPHGHTSHSSGRCACMPGGVGRAPWHGRFGRKKEGYHACVSGRSGAGGPGQAHAREHAVRLILPHRAPLRGKRRGSRHHSRCWRRPGPRHLATRPAKRNTSKRSRAQCAAGDEDSRRRRRRSARDRRMPCHRAAHAVGRRSPWHRPC